MVLSCPSACRIAYSTSLGNVSSKTSHASFTAALYELTSFFTLFFANNFPNRFACRCSFIRTAGILHTRAAIFANFRTKHLYGADAATSSATRPVIVGSGLLDASPFVIVANALTTSVSILRLRVPTAFAFKNPNVRHPRWLTRYISPAHTHAATSGPRRRRALRSQTTRAA
jgi:hypothetical protein